jgi:hypothetical protein
LSHQQIFTDASIVAFKAVLGVEEVEQLSVGKLVGVVNPLLELSEIKAVLF